MANKSQAALGRPRTNIKWASLGIRFKADEKPRVDKSADRQGISTQKFIRRATLAAVKQVEAGKKPSLSDSL